jgi:hypothetical protein
VRYELLVQPKDAGAAWDAAPLDQLLDQRGAFGNPDGSRTWRLKSGDVQVRLLIEGGRPIATELRVELTHKVDLIREVVIEGVALAAEAGARLVDPQLARTLTLNDEGPVADQYLRTAQYAGQYAGVSTAVLASYGSPDSDTGLKPGTRVLLSIIAFFVVLYLIAEKLF